MVLQINTMIHGELASPGELRYPYKFQFNACATASFGTSDRGEDIVRTA